jgi:hypothetical protein
MADPTISFVHFGRSAQRNRPLQMRKGRAAARRNEDRSP